MTWPPTDPVVIGIAAFLTLLVSISVVGFVFMWMLARLLPSAGVEVRGPFRLFQILARLAPWMVGASMTALLFALFLKDAGLRIGLMSIAAAFLCFFSFGWGMAVVARRLGLQAATSKFHVRPVVRRDGKLFSQRGAYVLLFTIIALVSTFTYPIFMWAFGRVTPLRPSIPWIVMSVLLDVGLLLYLRSQKCWVKAGAT